MIYIADYFPFFKFENLTFPYIFTTFKINNRSKLHRGKRCKIREKELKTETDSEWAVRVPILSSDWSVPRVEVAANAELPAQLQCLKVNGIWLRFQRLSLLVTESLSVRFPNRWKKLKEFVKIKVWHFRNIFKIYWRNFWWGSFKVWAIFVRFVTQRRSFADFEFLNFVPRRARNFRLFSDSASLRNKTCLTVVNNCMSNSRKFAAFRMKPKLGFLSLLCQFLFFQGKFFYEVFS